MRKQELQELKNKVIADELGYDQLKEACLDLIALDLKKRKQMRQMADKIRSMKLYEF